MPPTCGGAHMFGDAALRSSPRHSPSLGMLQTLHPSKLLPPAPPTPSCARLGFVLQAVSVLCHGAATRLPCTHLCGSDRAQSRAPEAVPGERIAALCLSPSRRGRTIRVIHVPRLRTRLPQHPEMPVAAATRCDASWHRLGEVFRAGRVGRSSSPLLPEEARHAGRDAVGDA